MHREREEGGSYVSSVIVLMPLLPSEEFLDKPRKDKHTCSSAEKSFSPPFANVFGADLILL